jgi:cytochrome o ubiquinol oxidase subunit I
MFGKLSLEAIPLHEPIVVVTVSAILLGGAGLFGLITYLKKWTYLWNELATGGCLGRRCRLSAA